MTTDPLDQFAPWPTDRDGATAEAMIAYSIVRGQAADASIQWGLGDRERQVFRMVSHFCTASLLIALRETDEAAADEAAWRLWTRLGDGSTLTELTYQWLAERGISPDEVSKAAREAFAARADIEGNLT